MHFRFPVHFRKDVKTMLRKLQEILSQRYPRRVASRSSSDSAAAQQPQFDGQLLDQKREDVYALMHQQGSSLR